MNWDLLIEIAISVSIVFLVIKVSCNCLYLFRFNSYSKVRLIKLKRYIEKANLTLVKSNEKIELIDNLNKSLVSRINSLLVQLAELHHLFLEN